MIKSIRTFGLAAVASAMLVAAPLAANANGYGENGSWQFRPPSEIVAKLMQVETMEKKKAQGYGPGDTYIGTYNQNIDTQNNVTAIGNYTEIGDGSCNGKNACKVHQENEDSPTTAAGTVNVDVNLNSNY